MAVEFVNLQWAAGRYPVYDDVPDLLKEIQWRKAPDEIDGKSFPGAGKYWRISPFTSAAPWNAVVPIDGGAVVSDFEKVYGRRPGPATWRNWTELNHIQRKDVLMEYGMWRNHFVKLVPATEIGTEQFDRAQQVFEKFGMGKVVVSDMGKLGHWCHWPDAEGGQEMRFDLPRHVVFEEHYDPAKGSNRPVVATVRGQLRMLSMGITPSVLHPNLPD